MPTDSYFYLSIQLEKCTMTLNVRICPVRTQISNTQRMNNSEMSTQKMNNLYVCYLDNIKSKRINADESK